MIKKTLFASILYVAAAGLCLPLDAHAQGRISRDSTLTLSLKEAFVMGVQNSRDVKSSMYDPLQAEQELQKAKTIYDPILFMNSSIDTTERPSESLLDGVSIDASLEQDRWQFQTGIKNRLPTGGSISLYQSGSRFSSNSEYDSPNPQYRSKVAAIWTQPLLKGFGDREGATTILVADLNRQISESAMTKAVTDILMDIASSYWQLYYEQNVIRINEDSFARATEIYEREQNRFEQGLTKQVDVNRAMGAMETRRSNLLRSENQARATMRQLWLQLNPENIFAPGEIPYLVIGDVPSREFNDWQRSRILEQALNHRKELQISKDTVAINKQQSRLAHHNQLPNLDLKLESSFNALDDDRNGLLGDPYNDDYVDWKAELLFEWPLGGRSATAERRMADFRLSQSKEDMRLSAERIALEVDLVLDELRLSKQELNATEAAMNAAQKVMEGEEVLFELGQKNNQDLLTGQDYYGAAQKDYYRTLSRFNLNLVALSKTRGKLLNTYGLKYYLDKYFKLEGDHSVD